jgi:phosphoribosylanthranilate isomerase
MLRLKVCGLKYPENIKQLIALQPDYMGFIFYPKSPRYCNESIDRDFMQRIPGTIQKTGVFVNENIRKIIQTVNDFSLDIVQLHGNETSGLCKDLHSDGIPLIKAFQIDNQFDFQTIAPYLEYCKYFLFDTKTTSYGGSGLSFDWNILSNYIYEKPFFISGGIYLDDLPKLNIISHLNIYGLDINSRFETVPGYKNLSKITEMIQKIKEYNQQNNKTE